MSDAFSPSPPAHQWKGYHLFLPNRLEEVVCQELPSLLRRERNVGRFRRFFFIRYGQGADAHLRLRFMPGERWRDRWVRAALEMRGGRVQERPYCRTTHYFGENRASVFAELLNEATSWLALDVLGALGPNRRAERWVVLAALSDLLIAAANRPMATTAAIADSVRFAAAAARRLEVALPISDQASTAARAAAVERARPRIAQAFRSHPEAAHTIRLLRRMGRLGNAEVTVATHGMHLLWNKAGFSLADEHAAFTILSRLEHRTLSEEEIG